MPRPTQNPRPQGQRAAATRADERGEQREDHYDPQGFADLTHAYTLFAPSSKVRNPEQRGRFNLGEKLVIAVCEEATIITTTGTVRFDGTRLIHTPEWRTAGTLFTGTLRLSAREHAMLHAAVRSLIPPAQVVTTFNGEALAHRLIHREVRVAITNDLSWPFVAAYGHGHLWLNLARLGHAFFDGVGSEQQLRLLLHELSHERVADHLSHAFAEEIARLGARLAHLSGFGDRLLPVE